MTPGENVARFEAEIRSWAAEVWRFDDVRFSWYTGEGWTILHPTAFMREDPYRMQKADALRPSLEESLRRLRLRWPDAELSEIAADAYFSMDEWWPRFASRDREGILLRILAGACVFEYPPADMAMRLAEALPRQEHGAPQSLLYDLRPTPELLDLYEQILAGRMNLSIQSDGTARMLDRLFRAGRLSYDMFYSTVEPGWMRDAFKANSRFFKNTDPGFKDHLLGHFCQLMHEFAQNPDPDFYQPIRLIFGIHGGYELLPAALRLLETEWRRPLHYNDFREETLTGDWFRLSTRTRPPANVNQLIADLEPEILAHRSGLGGAILTLARAAAAPDPAESQQARRQLREFAPDTLKWMLPFARATRPLLAGALGWERGTALIEQLARLTRIDTRPRPEMRIYAFEQRSTDPNDGIVDVAALIQALEQAGEELSHEIVEVFREAQLAADLAFMLIDAAMGRNREQIRAKIEKRHQAAVKAYGLLPLERGAEEAVERYLVLARFAKESGQFGAQRQANERAAVQVALANLAQLAGYGDATRLEWAMEARLGQTIAERSRSWELDGYRAEIEIDGAEVRLAVSREGKPLKSVPPALRRHERYPEIKQALALLREQAGRFRQTFEAMMAAGETLSRSDLEHLAQMPVARALLARLILRDAAGEYGLPDAELRTLQRLDGASVASDGALAIAHCYDLARAGCLAEWQAAIVRRRIVQPFKQAFRELYLITPAEQAAGSSSLRFAGHNVNARVAARLLQSRGWQLDVGEGDAGPYKLLPGCGLRATFGFADIGHYFAEGETVFSEAIWFTPLDTPGYTWGEWPARWIPLDQVPPLVFSEVMRDADLVVAVAQSTGEQAGEARAISPETYEQRGAVVSALLDDLGLPGVSVEGHFARVRGKLASYRVHLSSAAIHIEPGNYLCVVPAGGKRAAAVFLPFADEGDSRISEVISKILLLANDAAIKDPSIVSQIRRHAAGPQ